jgi:hypothetical protein
VDKKKMAPRKGRGEREGQMAFGYTVPSLAPKQPEGLPGKPPKPAIGGLPLIRENVGHYEFGDTGGGEPEYVWVRGGENEWTD